MIPVSEGLQRPRHPQLESSSPPTLNQSDKTVTNARKISTEGKNPLHTNRHSHTPPPLPVPGKRGLSAPETTLGPPTTNWESGNECSGELLRVRPHQSVCWHTLPPFNIVKPWPPTKASLLPGPSKHAVKWPPPLPGLCLQLMWEAGKLSGIQ